EVSSLIFVLDFPTLLLCSFHPLIYNNSSCLHHTSSYIITSPTNHASSYIIITRSIHEHAQNFIRHTTIILKSAVAVQHYRSRHMFPPQESIEYDKQYSQLYFITVNCIERLWDGLLPREQEPRVNIEQCPIKCVKFIARMKWIVAGTKNTDVHVYNFETMQKITSFRIAVSGAELVSLAIHPTQPYLLSVDFYIKLWDWDKNWECIRTFEYQNYLTCPVVLNPNNSFATASGDCTVEIWSFDSPKSNYALSGHSGKVNCLDFFTCHGQEFLITGSDDQTAKIWYLEKKICAYTLDAFMSGVTSVLYQPNHQTLIIGSEDGDIYLWSTTNCRIYSCPPTLKGIIKIGCVAAVYHLACLMGRVVIGKGKIVAIMYIHNVNYEEQSIDYNKQQVNTNKRQPVGDTSSKRISESIGNLLRFYPLELHFPYHPNEPIQCSLHLTNYTDQNVAFRLVDKSGEAPWCFAKLPLYGIVLHRSTYTLIVTTKEEMKLKRNTDFYLVIQSSLLGDNYKLFEDQSECDQFFKEAKEFGNMVPEVKLKVVYLDYEDIPKNIPVKYNRDFLCSLDAHPTEPWVLTGHRSGYARIWNHEMKYPMNSFYVSGHAVCYIKFIARRKFIVAVTSDSNLHVYSQSCVKTIEKIMIVRPIETTRYAILAVHPTLPFVSGYYDGDVKVWRLDSFVPEYSLLGHLDSVNCLDFITRGDQQYLITGSDDGTAKIWDLKKRKCIITLEATSPVLCVLARANLPILITGTKHGIIHVWSSTDFSRAATPYPGSTCRAVVDLDDAGFRLSPGGADLGALAPCGKARPRRYSRGAPTVLVLPLSTTKTNNASLVDDFFAVSRLMAAPVRLSSYAEDYLLLNCLCRELV
ncbi:hypothetical protein ZWY2020_050992, partial [Hordeum vulgare]